MPAATAGIHARVFDLTGSFHHGIQATDFHTDNACENGPPIDPLRIRDSNVPSMSPKSGLACFLPLRFHARY
jgi:hypothetical protein